ncbi:MAG: ATP-dependent DNA helicase RecG [Hydrogenophilus sp.]|nr:ATP-dependent DNA helicase RecG [Hydrogenophilus sp.]
MAGWPGIGEASIARLVRLGVRRPEDFLGLIPLRYEDWTRVTPIGALQVGTTALVEGEVVEWREEPTPRRGDKQLIARLRDDSGVLVGRWIHYYPSTIAQLRRGRWRWYGEVRAHFYGGVEMVHPRLLDPRRPLPTTLTPVYPTVEGLNQGQLRRWVTRALMLIPLREWLTALSVDPEVRNALGELPPLPEALSVLHQPPPGVDPQRAEWQAARRRVALDELVAHQAALRRARLERQGQRGARVEGAAAEKAMRRLIARLPFALTGAQQRAIEEVTVDLSEHRPMYRLVVGDVGSGKTVVAAAALARAVGGGFQGAFVAPTELLALQHGVRLTEWFEGIAPVALITAATPARARKVWQERLAAGEPLVVVGTHALFEEKTPLPRLALAVVDEQHRFGVRQRALLRAKCVEWVPHLLMMSATPIPRSLAMAAFAELDLSFLDEKPPGRQPVTTTLLPMSRRRELVQRLRHWVAQGRQAYWVCPRIEGEEEASLSAAAVVYEELAEALPEGKVALLHGRMRPIERQQVMTAFARGEVAVLVATTVVEVGVDVPNAALMVVEHAERFGLAQLHQLRGRVGRGGGESFCVLVYAEPLPPLARERLSALRREHDGFRLAELDLRLRGPGEINGVRQSGLPLLRVADFVTDEGLLGPAQQLADRLWREQPEIAAELVSRWVPAAEWAPHA